MRPELSKTSDPKTGTEQYTTEKPFDHRGVDNAWTFLNQHVVTDVDTNAGDLKKLRRKIDWHIVPLMFCCYIMQFLDKVILNVIYPL